MTHEEHPESPELTDAFLMRACLSYGFDDWPSKWRRAERIRVLHPHVRRANIYTAAVSGELEQVRSLLATQPQLAAIPGGPQGWPPLLFVAYGRIQNPAALEIATL